MRLEKLLGLLDGVRPTRTGHAARCPAHDDRSPSLSITLEDDGRVLLHCFGGCRPEAVCAAIGLSLRDLFPDSLHCSWKLVPPTRPGRVHPTRSLGFTEEQARRAWQAARSRARDDDAVDADREVYEYVAVRGLGEAWESPGFGVLHAGMELPTGVVHWPGRGYRLVVPLYDQAGVMVNVQGRDIRGGGPKTMFPKGSRVRGTAFANGPALRMLRRESELSQLAVSGPPVVRPSWSTCGAG